MVIEYFSAAYFLQLFTAAACVLLPYLLLRNRSERARRAALALLAAANVVQHLFKSVVWAPYFGRGFALENTAYNVCALLILATPFALNSKNRSFRQSVCCIGTVAAALPLAFPRWFIGQTLFQWEFARGWLCHVLLGATSLLPVLWKEVRIRFSASFHLGFWLAGMLCCVLLNNVLYSLVRGASRAEVRAALLAYDPFWIAEPAEPSALRDLLASAPLPFLGRRHPPVLWYLVPVFLTATALSCLFGLLCERPAAHKKTVSRKILRFPAPAV